MNDITQVLIPLCCIFGPVAFAIFFFVRMDYMNGNGRINYYDFSLNYTQPWGWLKSKEMAELKVFDYKIAAAENNLNYKENPDGQLQKFRYINLIPKKKRRNNHAIYGSLEMADIHIFDETYPNELSQFTGIWIEFRQLELPNFDILDGGISDNLYPFDSMAKVDLNASLEGVDDRFKLLKLATQPTSEIENLLRHNDRLVSLLNLPDFYLLTIRKQHLCFYTKSRMLASAEHVSHLKNRAIELVNVFTLLVDEPIELADLEELKRSEQEQNTDV